MSDVRPTVNVAGSGADAAVVGATTNAPGVSMLDVLSKFILISGR
jgi:hypothetical protein